MSEDQRPDSLRPNVEAASSTDELGQSRNRRRHERELNMHPLVLQLQDRGEYDALVGKGKLDANDSTHDDMDHFLWAAILVARYRELIDQRQTDALEAIFDSTEESLAAARISFVYELHSTKIGRRIKTVNDLFCPAGDHVTDDADASDDSVHPNDSASHTAFQPSVNSSEMHGSSPGHSPSESEEAESEDLETASASDSHNADSNSEVSFLDHLALERVVPYASVDYFLSRVNDEDRKRADDVLEECRDPGFQYRIRAISAEGDEPISVIAILKHALDWLLDMNCGTQEEREILARRVRSCVYTTDYHGGESTIEPNDEKYESASKTLAEILVRVEAKGSSKFHDWAERQPEPYQKEADAWLEVLLQPTMAAQHLQGHQQRVQFEDEMSRLLMQLILEDGKNAEHFHRSNRGSQRREVLHGIHALDHDRKPRWSLDRCRFEVLALHLAVHLGSKRFRHMPWLIDFMLPQLQNWTPPPPAQDQSPHAVQIYQQQKIQQRYQRALWINATGSGFEDTVRLQAQLTKEVRFADNIGIASTRNANEEAAFSVASHLTKLHAAVVPQCHPRHNVEQREISIRAFIRVMVYLLNLDALHMDVKQMSRQQILQFKWDMLRNLVERACGGNKGKRPLTNEMEAFLEQSVSKGLGSAAYAAANLIVNEEPNMLPGQLMEFVDQIHKNIEGSESEHDPHSPATTSQDSHSEPRYNVNPVEVGGSEDSSSSASEKPTALVVKKRRHVSFAPSLPTSDTEDAGPRVRIPAARNAERVNLNDSDDEERNAWMTSLRQPYEQHWQPARRYMPVINGAVRSKWADIYGFYRVLGRIGRLLKLVSNVRRREQLDDICIALRKELSHHFDVEPDEHGLLEACKTLQAAGGTFQSTLGEACELLSEVDHVTMEYLADETKDRDLLRRRKHQTKYDLVPQFVFRHLEAEKAEEAGGLGGAEEEEGAGVTAEGAETPEQGRLPSEVSDSNFSPGHIGSGDLPSEVSHSGFPPGHFGSGSLPSEVSDSGFPPGHFGSLPSEVSDSNFPPGHIDSGDNGGDPTNQHNSSGHDDADSHDETHFNMHYQADTNTRIEAKRTVRGRYRCLRISEPWDDDLVAPDTSYRQVPQIDNGYQVKLIGKNHRRGCEFVYVGKGGKEVSWPCNPLRNDIHQRELEINERWGARQDAATKTSWFGKRKQKYGHDRGHGDIYAVKFQERPGGVFQDLDFPAPPGGYYTEFDKRTGAPNMKSFTTIKEQDWRGHDIFYLDRQPCFPWVPRNQDLLLLRCCHSRLLPVVEKRAFLVLLMLVVVPFALICVLNPWGLQRSSPSYPTLYNDSWKAFAPDWNLLAWLLYNPFFVINSQGSVWAFSFWGFCTSSGGGGGDLASSSTAQTICSGCQWMPSFDPAEFLPLLVQGASQEEAFENFVKSYMEAALPALWSLRATWVFLLLAIVASSLLFIPDLLVMLGNIGLVVTRLLLCCKIREALHVWKWMGLTVRSYCTRVDDRRPNRLGGFRNNLIRGTSVYNRSLAYWQGFVDVTHYKDTELDGQRYEADVNPKGSGEGHPDPQDRWWKSYEPDYRPNDYTDLEAGNATKGSDEAYKFRKAELVRNRDHYRVTREQLAKAHGDSPDRMTRWKEILKSDRGYTPQYGFGVGDRGLVDLFRTEHEIFQGRHRLGVSRTDGWSRLPHDANEDKRPYARTGFIDKNREYAGRIRNGWSQTRQLQFVMAREETALALLRISDCMAMRAWLVIAAFIASTSTVWFGLASLQQLQRQAKTFEQRTEFQISYGQTSLAMLFGVNILLAINVFTSILVRCFLNGRSERVRRCWPFCCKDAPCFSRRAIAEYGPKAIGHSRKAASNDRKAVHLRYSYACCPHLGIYNPEGHSVQWSACLFSPLRGLNIFVSRTRKLAGTLLLEDRERFSTFIPCFAWLARVSDMAPRSRVGRCCRSSARLCWVPLALPVLVLGAILLFFVQLVISILAVQWTVLKLFCWHVPGKVLWGCASIGDYCYGKRGDDDSSSLSDMTSVE